MRNYDFNDLLKKSNFCGTMGVAATVAPKGQGSQDPTKKLSHRVDLLGQPLFRKPVF